VSAGEPRRAAASRPRRVRSLLATTAAVVSTLALTSACSVAAPNAVGQPAGRESATSDRRAASLKPAWLMTHRVVSELTGDPVVRRALADGPLDELLEPGQAPVHGVPARSVVAFASAATLSTTVRAHDLPPGTYGVLYDPEAWDFTPSSEQRHPVAAAARAAASAHADGLRFIVAPALDLTTVLAPGGQTPREQEFLALRLVGRFARSADVIELQAQSLERAPSRYRAFVQAAAAQALAANPRVKLLAGLSSNPPGSAVTVGQLRRDIGATRSAVAGYWLNIPGQGARCPTCNPARLDIAIQLTLRP
jgi:hypothetical protein